RPVQERRPVAPPGPVQPAHRARGGARQRHRVRQPPRSPPPGARAGGSGPRRRAHSRNRRRPGLRPGRRARSHAPGPTRARGRAAATRRGPAWLEPGPDVDDMWLEVRDPGPGARDATALAAIVGSVLAAERDAAQVAAELSERYEEIDLIYTISEILGQTIRLDEAADRILREVAGVVRARRATLLVHDRERGLLRIVATQGMDAPDIEPIEVDDPC